AGRLADSYPLRSLFMLLPVGAVLFSIPMVLAGNAYEFLVLRILLGLCAGGVLTLSYTAGGRLIPEGSRGAAFGLFSSAAMIGGAVGPMVIGLVAAWRLSAVFWASALLYGLVLAWAWWQLPAAREPGLVEERHRSQVPARPA
ncbi:MAG: MFS transporter, partial [Deinococcus sp.]|nr:MFS transporter [Deinococcus sp.]